MLHNEAGAPGRVERKPALQIDIALPRTAAGFGAVFDIVEPAYAAGQINLAMAEMLAITGAQNAAGF